MRRWAVVIAVIAVALIVGWRRCDRSDRSAPAGVAAKPSVKRVDRTVAARGSIAGTVIDEAKAPIAGAFVCADDSCVKTDARGAFRIDLPPAAYTVRASAHAHRPARVPVVLAAGQSKDITVTLRSGGVEITGLVSDLTGGPIANARVISDDAMGETAADGTFSLWVAPTHTSVEAYADGYAPGFVDARPPSHVELFLTPEGVVTGTVVDARTKEPVAGVHVYGSGSLPLSPKPAITDEQGRFRLSQLAAARYELFAIAPNGYGRSQGSIVVGVGAQVSGIVLELHPGARVVGHVVVAPSKTPCEDPSVSMVEVSKDRRRSLAREGASVVAHGVLPGSYRVELVCVGHVSRDDYPPIVVGTADVDVTWEVDRGSRIEGTITRRSGAPVEGMYIRARSMSARDCELCYDDTDADGHYTIDGVPPGKTKVSVPSSDAEAIVDATRDATVRRDFVLDDTGTIQGTVRDATGKPVPRVIVGAGQQRETHREATDAQGNYHIKELPPGEYAVSARRFASSEDVTRVARVTVQANQATAVSLVLSEPAGSITGSVIDEAGRPVTDAYINVAHDRLDNQNKWEALRETWGLAPTMTTVDGAFTVTQLPPGSYTVRAQRPGSADALAEHVAVGSSVRLQLRPTASIAGVVRSWSSSLDELSIRVEDPSIRYYRSERFFRTNGAFAIDDLPPGHFTVAAGAEGKQTQIALDLAIGEQKRGLELVLVPLVTVTGHVVDHITKQPVAGAWIDATTIGSSTGYALPQQRDRNRIVSDRDGRFVIENVPTGKLLLSCGGRNLFVAYAMRTLNGAGTIDVGELLAVRAQTELSGESGMELADLSEWGESARAVVGKISPNGPAAKAGILVGDIVMDINGLPTIGYTVTNAWSMLVAPAGTRLSITLARGVTVNVVLASRVR